MAFQSFGDCPWCGAHIELRKEGRDYVCPVCACTFSRNPAKWKVGIPAAILVACLLWIFVPLHGRIAAFFGAIAVLIATAKSFHHQILSRGRSDLTVGEAKQHKAEGKESKWFFAAIAVVLAAILVLLTLVLVLMAKR
jgi:hypothetical protein